MLPLSLLFSLLGTGGGGLLSGLMGMLGASKQKGGVKDFLFGSPERDIQYQRYTPEQQGGLDQMLQQGLQNFNPDALENLYTKRFQEDIIPSIAERFTSMGDGQRSSAFESALGRAGSDLTTQLAGLRSQMGQQQLGYGFSPRFDTAREPGTAGFLPGLGGKLLGSFGQLLPKAFQK